MAASLHRKRIPTIGTDRSLPLDLQRTRRTLLFLHESPLLETQQDFTQQAKRFIKRWVQSLP
jgi:hypothetical protein